MPKNKKTESSPKKESSSSEEEPAIGAFEKAPHYVKDNEHITSGYRLNFNTPRRILRSLFMVHNESVNIWSHCIPAVVIIFMLCTFFFVVDTEAVKASLEEYKVRAREGMDHYMHTLNNVSLMAKYDELSQNTKAEFG